MPSVLRNRDFLLLWSGNAVAHVGLKGAMFAYPLLALFVTNSPVSASWVTFALTVPGVIFEIPSGVVADYLDRRRILVRCQFVGLAATLLAAVVAAVQPPGLTFLLSVAAFAEGTAYVFFNTSELGMVRDIVTESERPEAFSFLEAEQSIANMLGRTLGAATFGIARSTPFLANVVAYLYCLWTLAKLRTRVRAKSDPNGRNRARVWGRSRPSSGIRELWADPFVRGATIVLGTTNAIFQIVIMLITLKVKDGGYSAWAIGAVLGATGLGGMAGAIVASGIARNCSPRIVLTGVVWMWVVACVPIAASSNPVVLGVCFGGIGCGASILGVSLTLHRVRVFPEDHVGRIWGATKFVAHGATAAGALVAGGLLELLGTARAGWVLVVGLVLIARYARRLPESWIHAPEPVVAQPPVNWIEQLSRKGRDIPGAEFRAPGSA